jgi:hypothetical protein
MARHAAAPPRFRVYCFYKPGGKYVKRGGPRTSLVCELEHVVARRYPGGRIIVQKITDWRAAAF